MQQLSYRREMTNIADSADCSDGAFVTVRILDTPPSNPTCFLASNIKN